MSGIRKQGAGSALAVALGAGVAALSGLIVMTISARVLGTEQNSGFMTYWAALFAMMGVLSGIQNEMTRAVRTDIHGHNGEHGIEPGGANSESGSGSRRTSPLFMGLLVGGVASIVVLALYPMWIYSFAALDSVIIPVLLIAAAAVFYAGHVASVGTLAGQGRWTAFGALTGAESLVRLALSALAAVAGWSTVGFEIAAAAGTLTWFVTSLTIPGLRSLWGVRIAIKPGALARRMLNAMAATGANAVLVTGFPLLMSLTTDKATYALSAPLVLAVSMTRAPLLLPLTAFQAMVITSFVDHPERAKSTLMKLVAVLAGVALVGGIAAALVGPTLMRLVFGPDYGNTSLILGMLVVAASLLALLMLGGSIALALDSHTVNTIGWYAALVVSVALMLTPAGLATRTILALAIGPAVGSAIHLTFVLRELKRRSDGVLSAITNQEQ